MIRDVVECFSRSSFFPEMNCISRGTAHKADRNRKTDMAGPNQDHDPCDEEDAGMSSGNLEEPEGYDACGDLESKGEKDCQLSPHSWGLL